MIEVADWVYSKGNDEKAFSVREVIRGRFALVAPIYTRLYQGTSEVVKVTDGLTLMESGNYEMN